MQGTINVTLFCCAHFEIVFLIKIKWLTHWLEKCKAKLCVQQGTKNKTKRM